MRPREISNLQLTLADIPDDVAEFEAVEQFARSFNGYAYAGSEDAAADIWNKFKIRHRQTREVTGGLSDLRTALFYEQQISRHLDVMMDPDFVSATLTAIRQAVMAREIQLEEFGI